MSLQIAFQMDALARLNAKSDSTLYIARAAAIRGYELFHYEPQHMRLDIDGGATHVSASGHALLLKNNEWVLGEKQTFDLTDFDFILMRQDPPFDLAYITATHVLEHVKGKTKIINNPAGVRNAPEKLVVTHFPQFMPPTLITRDQKNIEEFRTRHGSIIIKPLHSNAGHGVFHIKPDDDNLPSLIETMTGMNNEPWMIQKFLPIKEWGDKRIIVIDGEPVGAYVRSPAKGDMRGNARVGAKPTAAAMTKRDADICVAFKPLLREQGLFLAGVDVIGDYLTEINVTSPTGLVAFDQLNNRGGKDNLGELFWQRAVG
jgi:glutathione synthase